MASTARFFALLIFATVQFCCSKQSSSLPTASSTGSNTFGCLIDGKVFTNGGSAFSGSNLSVFYGFSYRSPVPPGSALPAPSGWLFQVNAIDQRNNCAIKSIVLEMDSIPLVEGKSYSLVETDAGQASARFNRTYCASDSIQHMDNTKLTAPGDLTITKLDTISRIVSGQFQFSVVDTFGVTVKITEGRFDFGY